MMVLVSRVSLVLLREKTHGKVQEFKVLRTTHCEDVETNQSSMIPFSSGQHVGEHPPMLRHSVLMTQLEGILTSQIMLNPFFLIGNSPSYQCVVSLDPRFSVD